MRYTSKNGSFNGGNLVLDHGISGTCSVHYTAAFIEIGTLISSQIWCFSKWWSQRPLVSGGPNRDPNIIPINQKPNGLWDHHFQRHERWQCWSSSAGYGVV